MEESEHVPQANQRIDLAYELEVNRWNGEVKLQLNVRDMVVKRANVHEKVKIVNFVNDEVHRNTSIYDSRFTYYY